MKFADSASHRWLAGKTKNGRIFSGGKRLRPRTFVSSRRFWPTIYKPLLPPLSRLFGRWGALCRSRGFARHWIEKSRGSTPRSHGGSFSWLKERVTIKEMALDGKDMFSGRAASARATFISTNRPGAATFSIPNEATSGAMLSRPFLLPVSSRDVPNVLIIELKLANGGRRKWKFVGILGGEVVE